MHDLSPILKKYSGEVVTIPHYLYYYRIRQGSICHGDEPSLIEKLKSLREILIESKKENSDFAHKLEMNCLQSIIFLNGQIELKQEWKKRYTPTYRPLMKQISIQQILTFQTSWIFKIVMLIIRLYPAAYPILWKVKRKLSNILYRHK
jgi:hypothetical protein